MMRGGEDNDGNRGEKMKGMILLPTPEAHTKETDETQRTNLS